MCGRFTLKTPLGKWLFELFGEEFAFEFPSIEPRFNIAPTQSILIVGRDPTEHSLHLEEVRWGLIPSWAKEISSTSPLINARSETLAEKPAFRHAFVHGRCAIIADGYYEWKTTEKKSKQPFWIHRPDETPFLIAGVSATNRQIAPEQSIRSATIVTTGSNDALSGIHHRMPVVLDSDEKLQRWLSPDPELQSQRLCDLSPAPNDFFQTRRVSSWVGNPRHEDARCIVAQPSLWQRTLNIDEPVEPDT